MDIPLLRCELFIILSTRILRVNSPTKAIQHRLATGTYYKVPARLTMRSRPGRALNNRRTRATSDRSIRGVVRGGARALGLRVFRRCACCVQWSDPRHPDCQVAPGATIRVEVVGKLRRAYAGEPKIGDHIP